MADDHSADAEGMDVSEGVGRAQAGGFVARAPDSDHRSGDESEAPEAGGAVDAELPAGEVVRRAGRAAAGVEGDGADGDAADYGEPACQRRAIAQAAGDARFPRLRGEGREAGTG